MTPFRFTLLCALAGCATDPTADVFAPDEVTTGIYHLATTTTSDTCDPPRFAGTATVPLVHTAGAIEFFDTGTLGARAAHELLATAGYALRTPPEGERLDPCAPSASSVVFAYTLAGASSDQVTVVEDETWSLVGTCSSIGTVGVSAIPTASCAATRTLRYDLVSACDAPCVLKTIPTPADLVCVCGP